MSEICRLCCSTKFVNNNIFDEESALYVKMSLYLPIKVFSDDKLPQKICDKCSCKVNDFYQFCSEAIEVESRLRSLLLIKNNLTNESVDLTVVKGSTSPPPSNLKISLHKSTQTESNFDFTYAVQVKEEPKATTMSPVKEEDAFSDHMDASGARSSDSEDVSLVNLKKKRKPKKLPVNGEMKKTRKKKGNIDKWEMLMSALPAGTELTVVDNKAVSLGAVKVEIDENSEKNVDVYQCCICFAKCYRKSEMLQHYRKHASEAADSEPAAPPPPPDQDPLRCTRCRKVVSRAEWAPHWARHWARDRRPYRCARCERAFRDPHQILKHGLTHNFEEDVEPESMDKRFVCDLCPETFVYMRYLLSHRTRAHPEAACRALALRCGVCECMCVCRARGRAGTCCRTARARTRRRRAARWRCAAACVSVCVCVGRVAAQVPAVAPHARAPGGGVPRAGAALRRVRAPLRAHQLAAPPPARALGRAQLPLQRVRQGSLQPRAPQVPHPHPHRIQAQRLQDVWQGVCEKVQPDAARARALGREAARVLALRQGVQPALHACHTRTVPQRRAAVRVRAVRPRLRGQGAALHAPQDHLHIAPAALPAHPRRRRAPPHRGSGMTALAAARRGVARRGVAWRSVAWRGVAWRGSSRTD